MEQLLYRYANLQCTAEEKRMVYEYVEADFGRCFELIRLMKMRAYHELRPQDFQAEEEHVCNRQITPKIAPSCSMDSVSEKKKSSRFSWLYNFFTDEDEKEDTASEFVDESRNDRDEELLSASLDEFFQGGIQKEVSSVKEPVSEYKASLSSLFTASGFLGLLADYVDSPD